MGFDKKNKQQDSPQNQFQNKPMNQNDRISQMEEFMQETVRMINLQGSALKHQGDALRNSLSKIAQLSFKLGKTEEELHLVRISNRTLRDKFNTSFKSMSELGLFDEEIFNIVASKLENKYLPVNSEGHINGNVLMIRYNPPPNIPHPERMMQI
jgi:hypothetical protein